MPDDCPDTAVVVVAGAVVVVVVCFLCVVVVSGGAVVVVACFCVVVVSFGVEVVVDDVVVDEVELGVDEVDDAGGTVSFAFSRSSWSGDAVKMRSTGIPSCAFFMTSLNTRAGNEPPVTGRPCTRVKGLPFSG